MLSSAHLYNSNKRIIQFVKENFQAPSPRNEAAKDTRASSTQPSRTPFLHQPSTLIKRPPRGRPSPNPHPRDTGHSSRGTFRINPPALLTGKLFSRASRIFRPAELLTFNQAERTDAVLESGGRFQNERNRTQCGFIRCNNNLYCRRIVTRLFRRWKGVPGKVEPLRCVRDWVEVGGAVPVRVSPGSGEG